MFPFLTSGVKRLVEYSTGQVKASRAVQVSISYGASLVHVCEERLGSGASTTITLSTCSRAQPFCCYSIVGGCWLFAFKGGMELEHVQHACNHKGWKVGQQDVG